MKRNEPTGARYRTTESYMTVRATATTGWCCKERRQAACRCRRMRRHSCKRIESSHRSNPLHTPTNNIASFIQGEPMSRNTLNTLKEFKISGSKKGKLHSLPALEKSLGVKLSRLPVSIRIVLESV